MSFFGFTVKPTVQIPGDKTPELSADEDEENEAPVGDILLLTTRVSENAKTPQANAADVPASARVRVYSNKKQKADQGASGSSGQSKRKVTATVSKAPVQDDDDSSSGSSADEEEKPTATQTITVGCNRGYSYYPGYIFDIPPKKLKTDTLRKKLMISEIKRSETQTEFYQQGMVLMGHVKEFIHYMMTPENSQHGHDKDNSSDHGYAMHKRNSDQNGGDVHQT